MLLKLWNDERGSGLLTAEWLFLFAILALGIISGIVAVRQALISELVESAQAVLAINQSYSFSGQSNCEAITAGSSGVDVDLTDTTNLTFFNNGRVSASLAVINQQPCD